MTNATRNPARAAFFRRLLREVCNVVESEVTVESVVLVGFAASAQLDLNLFFEGMGYEVFAIRPELPLNPQDFKEFQGALFVVETSQLFRAPTFAAAEIRI